MRWRLHYLDRAPVTEPDGGMSIKLAPRGAVGLEASGKMLTIPIGCRPIWYRHRGIALDGGGAFTIATVAGVGKMTGAGQVEGNLYLVTPHDMIDLPEHLIDRGAIENCLEG